MSDYPLVYAHRGASSLAPENTIAAFAKAYEVGARRLEFDVDIMGDGSLIVIHDSTLDRTTSGSGGYYDKGFDDIRHLDAGLWFSDNYRLERIPELSDVVSFINSTGMYANLEIKPCSGGESLRTRLIETLPVITDTFAHSDRLLVSSFDHDILGRFHRERPDVALAWLFEKDLPGPTWQEGAAAIRCQALHTTRKGLTREQVTEMRDAGFTVGVWTVDDPEDALEFASWGVTHIFTDCPQNYPDEALAR